ncbi:A24 family peptidase [Shewanella marina]|uniref:A24 family peptidase n=1 Tax=Shewanella marina TaxID=487319 RepID=UPI000471B495|nr:prepilin peptidase [Shewanella marina]
MLGLILLFILTLTISYWDTRYRRIPNRLVAMVLLTSLLISINQYGAGQLLQGLCSSLMVLGVSLLLFKFNIMAAGDGKLASALAITLVPSQLLLPLFLTAMIGGVLAIIYLVKDYVINRNRKRQHRGLPYGVAISFGFYIPILAAYY